MSIVQVIDQTTIDRIVASVMPRNATEADRLALATMMQSYGLNPLRKEVYPIVYGGRLSIVVGVDGWRRLAHQTGQYVGGEASYGYDADGRVESCTYTVTTKDGGKFSFTCWLDEFRQGTPTWNKSPRHMLQVKAEVHCLKRAFGLAGPTEYDAEAEVAEPVRVHTNEQLRRLNALAQGTVTAPSTEAVAAPAAAPVEESEPRPATAAPGWEQQLGQPATDGGPAEPTLEDLAEQVAALARQAGGKRTAMQALAKAKKDGKDEAGTRRVLEEWHEALSNTINKESMK